MNNLITIVNTRVRTSSKNTGNTPCSATQGTGSTQHIAMRLDTASSRKNLTQQPCYTLFDLGAYTTTIKIYIGNLNQTQLGQQIATQYITNLIV